MSKPSGRSLFGVIVFVVLFALVKGCDTESVKNAKGAQSTEPEKISAQELERLADIEQWYYDRPGSVDPNLKKELGKDSKHYKEMVSAAAYRVAARTREKIELVTTRDGRTFTVTTDGGGKYDIERADLKDHQGRYYDASDAINLPEVKTEYEKWIKKSCPSDADVVNVKELLRKNSANPATLDVDWFTSQKDLGVYKDGTRDLSVDFQNKNSFGVEMRYTATIRVSPKCVYKIVKLQKY